MKTISIILIAISAFLSVQHGWQALNIDKYPIQLKMLSDLEIGKTYLPFFGIPQTFFIGNLLNAFSIVALMALALRAGNPKIA